MAKKIKQTRPELKRYRDAMGRFNRYLPMLKLKQQQLQIAMRQLLKDRQATKLLVDQAQAAFTPYQVILHDISGLNIQELAKPLEVKTTTTNVAGVNLPVFNEAIFAAPSYSLFATPAWVDRALGDLRAIRRCEVKLDILDQQYQLLQKELTKISQRVNLFEKVKIPEAKEAIRVIRIKLGDEMTAAVGRAKIAKSKLSAGAGQDGRERQKISPEGSQS